MDRGLAEDYHSSRPRKSRLAAWASDQSRPLGSREELGGGGSSSTNLSSTARTSRSRPSGGVTQYERTRVEYWEGRPSRMHERVVLTRSEGRLGH